MACNASSLIPPLGKWERRKEGGWRGRWGEGFDADLLWKASPGGGERHWNGPTRLAAHCFQDVSGASVAVVLSSWAALVSSSAGKPVRLPLILGSGGEPWWGPCSSTWHYSPLFIACVPLLIDGAPFNYRRWASSMFTSLLWFWIPSA